MSLMNLRILQQLLGEVTVGLEKHFSPIQNFEKRVGDKTYFKNFL